MERAANMFTPKSSKNYYESRNATTNQTPTNANIKSNNYQNGKSWNGIVLNYFVSFTKEISYV